MKAHQIWIAIFLVNPLNQLSQYQTVLLDTRTFRYCWDMYINDVSTHMTIRIYSVTIESYISYILMLVGGWPTPLNTYFCSSLGMMTFPTEWKQTCSKPPTCWSWHAHCTYHSFHQGKSLGMPSTSNTCGSYMPISATRNSQEHISFTHMSSDQSEG